MSMIIGIDASRANVAQKTGVEQYTWHVIQELKRIIPAEYRVRLYTREPLQEALGDLPASWESAVLTWPPKRFWTQLRLSWEVFRRPPDLLFVPAHVLPPILPTRSIVTMHDVAFMVLPEAYSPHGNLYLRADARLAVRRASRILTVSEFSKSEITRWFGADPSRISVTPLGFDTANFRRVPQDETAGATTKYGVNGPYFIFVGRLERKKNLGGLLRAFREYKKLRPNDAHQLVLVGKRGRGYAHEMREFVGSALMNFIHELGYVAEQDIAGLYSGATALVFPSSYEGFGLPVLESWACGTPVITANTTSLPEVAGDAALLVDQTNAGEIAHAMARLSNDIALRERMIAAGTERLKNFSWETCARGTWEAMEKCLLEK